jgi:hypothetical protein
MLNQKIDLAKYSDYSFYLQPKPYFHLVKNNLMGFPDTSALVFPNIVVFPYSLLATNDSNMRRALFARRP